MRDVLIIAAREIRDKKLLFLGAALCAIMVLLTPLLPGARSENPVQVMTAAGLSLAIFFVGAITIFLGIGIISRDLGEGRMTFYLARPVRIWSIWLGKTLAVLLIALGCGLVLVLVPTLLGGGLLSLDMFIEDLQSYSLTFALVLQNPQVSLPLLVLLLTVSALHLGLGFRARSPWLGLDVAVMAGTGGLLWIALRPFLLQFTYRGSTLVNLATIAAGTLIVTVAIGNLVGFRRGRSDLHVTHKWTSLSTALLVVVGVASFAGKAHEAWSFGIDEMRWADFLAADDDTGWIAIDGRRAPDWNAYWLTKLLDVETGKSIPIPGDLWSIRFGRQSALFWERTQLDPPLAKLVKIDLNSGKREDLDYQASANLLGLLDVDPDGKVAAWAVNEQLQVIDAATGRSIFSAKLPVSDRWTGWALPYLQDSKTLLVYSRDQEKGWTIHRIDLDEKSIETTGTLPEGHLLGFSGEHLLCRTNGQTSELRRADTGELVAELEPGTRLLSAGRTLVGDAEDPVRLLLRGPDGETEKVIELPRPGTLGLVLEPRDGALLVSQFSRRGDSKGLTTWFVDLITNQVTEIGRGIQPQYLGWRDRGVPPAGSVGSRILKDRDGALFLFDPDTLELKHLAGGSNGPGR